MNLRYPPEAETFRAELRSWLEANLPDDLPGHTEHLERGSDELERLRSWNRVLADAGYAALSWPEEYGGRGASLMQQIVFNEEMDRVQAPGPVNIVGMPNIAPAIMQWGTEEQKVRFLPRMLRGDDIWCQGMSEPDAGSDLASLQCRAVLDGDVFVLNGQKTWNTLGSVADWCQLYVRTDPSVAKHKGISCLLVDMTLPGVEVRPLVTITGDPGFSELFFTDVRVPASALLGPLDEGWKVATTTLAHERAGVAKLHLSLRRSVRELIDEARGTGAADDPVVRQKLARVYLEAEYLKLLADRAISGQLHGRALGPEGSVAKLVWADVQNHLAEVASDVYGADGWNLTNGMRRVSVRSVSIAGGTTQVNKNIVAQRVLGMPRGL
jgi:alkylation response protein AidB-like acyl-CoA dehydrogenase